VTLAMAMASTRMAEQTLVRHLPAIEALGAATLICTDKTGTLTENRMSAERIFVAGGGRRVDDVLVDRRAIEIHHRLSEIALCCEDVRSVDRDEHVQAGWRSDGDRTSLILAGLVGLEDPPRSAVLAAVERCHRAGIKVVTITGDHPATAIAIGRQIGLIRSATPRLITGPEFASCLRYPTTTRPRCAGTGGVLLVLNGGGWNWGETLAPDDALCPV
jgi:magnesium-transporting ATPase (P-type)